MISILEIRREIFHIIVGILFILIVLFIPQGEILLFIVFVFGTIASLLSTRVKLPIIHNFLCMFERKCNKNLPGKGVIYFFLGSLLALQLFSRETALASITILTFADPISHFIGSSFGRIKLASERKNIEGTIAGILIGTIFASFFVSIWLAFAASFAAMFFELLGIKLAESEIDDNLLIPLVAGTTIFLILKFII